MLTIVIRGPVLLASSLAQALFASGRRAELLKPLKNMPCLIRPQWTSTHQCTGQSELTATNAPVGRSVHWMGCVFSFGAGWGSSRSISFCCLPLYFFFLFFFFWFLAVFPGPDLTHSYPAHFPTLISIAPTYWHSYPYILLSYSPSYCTNHLPY